MKPLIDLSENLIQDEQGYLRAQSGISAHVDADEMTPVKKTFKELSTKVRKT